VYHTIRSETLLFTPFLQTAGLKALVIYVGDENPFLIWGLGGGIVLDIIPIWDYNNPMKTKATEAKFNARFPLEVFNALRALAKEHQRSINSELVWIVRQYIERQSKNEC